MQGLFGYKVNFWLVSILKLLFYRAVQMDYIPVIEVLDMLFDRFHSKNSKKTAYRVFQFPVYNSVEPP